MKKIFIYILTLLLSACATQWQKTIDEHGEKKYSLKIQNHRSFPDTGLIFIETEQLHAGDIIFSSNKGLMSKSIRYLAASPVSHAFIYIGNNQVAEAVTSGIQISNIEDTINKSATIAVYRHPQFTDKHEDLLRQFAYQHLDKDYNHFGIVKQLPYSITRKVCELPVIPRHTRHLCLNTMGVVEISTLPQYNLFLDRRYFCSQFVMESYKYIGLPLSSHNPEWISPADLLHMRENDVASFVPNIRLQYVGHLRYKNDDKSSAN